MDQRKMEFSLGWSVVMASGINFKTIYLTRKKHPFGRFLLALAEGLEHSSLFLALSKNSVKNTLKDSANESLIFV